MLQLLLLSSVLLESGSLTFSFSLALFPVAPRINFRTVVLMEE